MALAVWDPFSTLAQLDRQFDEVVRRSWAGNRSAHQPPRRRSGFVPAADISTEGDDVVITLELPGVDVATGVDIEVGRGRLSISGQREEQERSEEGKAVISERRYGAFRREFSLPETVDPEQVDASYEQGLLKVRVPGVAGTARESRKVEIRRDDTPKAVEGESHD